MRATIIIFLSLASVAHGGSPWGASYFPNVELTTSEGETVRFFDDLIKDRIVAINFIYTSCPDTCPLETAQLVKVQNIMGDRVGRDVFFYSISIDPEHDTPDVLGEYKERFGARWTFLTGDKDEIISLRKKLGLYIQEIQDGSNNHNVSMIIGNQSTGRWMKRSPFENPYVLADQIGNWLDGWRAPQQTRDYAEAPALRNIAPGEHLFRTRCQSCHTISGEEKPAALGPDLLGVTRQRDPEWLLNWLRAPDRMLADKDPLAIALYEKYNRLAMPNMRLNKQEALDLLAYMDEETERLSPRATGGVVAIEDAWVREAHPMAKANAGYMTLLNESPEEVTLVGVESDGFASVEVHEMAVVDGLMEMRQVPGMTIPPNGRVRFEPGGKHLMLLEPQTHYSSGQKIDMKLIFDSGKQQKVSVSVESR